MPTGSWRHSPSAVGRRTATRGSPWHASAKPWSTRSPRCRTSPSPRWPAVSATGARTARSARPCTAPAGSPSTRPTSRRRCSVRPTRRRSVGSSWPCGWPRAGCLSRPTTGPGPRRAGWGGCTSRWRPGTSTGTGPVSSRSSSRSLRRTWPTRSWPRSSVTWATMPPRCGAAPGCCCRASPPTWCASAPSEPGRRPACGDGWPSPASTSGTAPSRARTPPQPGQPSTDSPMTWSPAAPARTSSRLVARHSPTWSPATPPSTSRSSSPSPPTAPHRRRRRRPRRPRRCPRGPTTTSSRCRARGRPSRCSCAAAGFATT